jgi:hypothetical protein
VDQGKFVKLKDLVRCSGGLNAVKSMDLKGGRDVQVNAGFLISRSGGDRTRWGSGVYAVLWWQILLISRI